jgi:flagellar protein FliS
MGGSSPQKLLLAVFDRLTRDIKGSIASIETGRIEEAHHALVNAQELVYELNLALDPDVWPAAAEMRMVYEHLMEKLIEANLTKSIQTVSGCLAIVAPLADGWAEAHRSLQANQVSGGGESL